jgi:hypothetical protein
MFATLTLKALTEEEMISLSDRLSKIGFDSFSETRFVQSIGIYEKDFCCRTNKDFDINDKETSNLPPRISTPPLKRTEGFSPPPKSENRSKSA